MSSSKPGEIFGPSSKWGCLSFSFLFFLMVFSALFVYFYLPLTKSYREATVDFAHHLEEGKWYPVNTSSRLSEHPESSYTPIKAEVRGRVIEFYGPYAIMETSEYRELEWGLGTRPISDWRQMSKREYRVPRYEVSWEMGGIGDLIFGIIAFLIAGGVQKAINSAGREIVKIMAGTGEQYGQGRWDGVED